MPHKKINKKVKRTGSLLIIGGKEDKQNEMVILKEIAKAAGRAKLVLVTVASAIPHEVWEDYRKIFNDLGVSNIVHFTADQPDEARDAKHLALFEKAKVVFFTGGDQLKITTKLGGTPALECIRRIYHKGGMIAGTSAGAAMMGKTMLVGGENSESHKVGNWMMAPGLSFLDVVIDQHFAQRGRIGRLLGAVALNPGILGIGIDEDTSILVKDGNFKVIGTNAVYVIDGQNVSSTNISEAAAEKTMSMHHVVLHVLGHSEKFNLKNRIPAR